MTNCHFVPARCYYFALCMLFPIASVAEQITDVELVVSTAIPSPNGLLIGFTTQPSGCSGSVNTMHALLPKSLENYDRNTLTILRNRALKKAVTLDYIDNGDCTTVDTVLEITAIK